MSGAQTEEAVRSAVPVADLSAVEAALEGDLEQLKQAVAKVRPADLGRDLSRRTLDEGRKLVEASDDRRAAAMLRAAHPAVAANVLGNCDVAGTARLLDFMPTDHQVAILGAMDDSSRAQIEAALPADARAKVMRILAFDEDAVARLMSPKLWRCDENASVGDALAILRDRKNQIEVAQNCYITDAQDHLVGVIPLRELAVMDGTTRIADVMTRNPIAVTEQSSRSDAADIIRTHDFLSLPVLDHDGKLTGAVRVDDLLDAALSRLGDGMLSQGGVTSAIAARLPYFQTSLLKVVRSRITWLILLFVAETATGTVLRYFEGELAKVVALSFFIPLLIGTGGNAGSQTVSTIIRALALGEVRLRDALRVLAREATGGILLGLLLGGIAFGRALLWGVGYDLAACVGITIVVVCTWATTVGALIPLGAQRAGIDPTVVSGPLITTLVDASGLFIYLTIAHVMISQLR
ncbi:MAG TPA: magnesium transporter [Polyangiales bacterium]|jgi:magnesium transporter|nr:magnesium transporter [Polyangiales bacterium]